MEALKLIDVTPKNLNEETFFCIKDIKKPGFDSKRKWFEKRYKEGLHLKILKDSNGKMIGFIEFVPASHAWRPVNAEKFMFIHCMVVYSKKDRNKGYGKILISEAEKEAKKMQLSGLCVMTSNGSWIANKDIFNKYGFTEVDKRGRFELLSKTWGKNVDDPKLFDWTKQEKKI